MLKALKRDVSQPVKASFWFMVANFFQQGLSIITLPIFTRLLSTTDYGITSVFNSWSGLLTVIVTLSLSMGVFNNGLLDFDRDSDGFTSSMLGLSSLSALVFYGVFLVFQTQFCQAMQLSPLLVNAMFLSFLLNPALSFWMAKQRFYYKYKLCIVLSLSTAVISPILSYFAVICFPNGKAAARILSGLIVTLSVNVVLYVYLFVKGKKFFDWTYWKYALVFNLPLIPHYLAQIALAQVDRIMISHMIGTAQAGIYSIGYSAASVVSIVWVSINSSWIPWTLKKMKEKKYADIGTMTRPLLMICAAACIGFVAFVPEVIMILAPPSYYQAIYVVPPVVVGLYFIFIYSLFGNIAFYHKKTIFVMIASLSAAILNVALNFLLLPVFGYMAAAYATMAGYLFLCVILYSFMKRIEQHPIYDMKFLVSVSAGVILFSGVMMCLYNFMVIRYILIGCMCLAVFACRKRLMAIVRAIKS